MATDNDTLKRFFTELQTVLTSDHKPSWFNSDSAICSTLHDWCSGRGPGWEGYKKLKVVLYELFESEGLHRIYPFNYGQMNNFNNEVDECEIWNNPLRLDFVKRHAGE